ncbi:UNVERIFIED_CONTAM: hypothetical protein FKN15_035162 [Acipenser sinensis]
MGFEGILSSFLREQNSIRLNSYSDRAGRSMTQLRSVLEEQPSAEAALSPKKGPGMAHSSPWVTGGWREGDLKMTWKELQHSHADRAGRSMTQLRSVLEEQPSAEAALSPKKGPGMAHSSPWRPSEKRDADLPAVQDLVPIINSQSEYIQHLEAEVMFCKDELSGMKHRIRVVILENDNLQEELKLKTVEDTLKDYTILDTSTNALESCLTGRTVPRAPDSRQHSHRQQQQQQPPTAPRQPLASNGPTEALKWQMELALIQCEQLKKEILRQKGRLQMELAAEQEKITKAKETAREEMMKEKEELAASGEVAKQQKTAKEKKVKECQEKKPSVSLLSKPEKVLKFLSDPVSKVMSLSVKVASLEGQLERLTRENNSVASQLEEAQRQLTSQDLDISKVCGELRYQLNQSQLKRDEAEKELREFRTKTTRDLELREQEMEKLHLELSETKQRLERAQQDSAHAKDEFLRLTELLGRSEHQLHLTRLEKEAAVCCRSDNVKALTFQAQHHEQELIQKIQQMEAQHEKSGR